MSSDEHGPELPIIHFGPVVLRCLLLRQVITRWGGFASTTFLTELYQIVGYWTSRLKRKALPRYSSHQKLSMPGRCLARHFPVFSVSALNGKMHIACSVHGCKLSASWAFCLHMQEIPKLQGCNLTTCKSSLCLDYRDFESNSAELMCSLAIRAYNRWEDSFQAGWYLTPVYWTNNK